MAGSASNVGALALNQYAQALHATAGCRKAECLLTAEVNAAFRMTILEIDMFIHSVASQACPTQAPTVSIRSIHLGLQRMRDSKGQGQLAAVRDIALAIMATATGAGWHGLAGRAARAAWWRGPLPRRVLDDLQLAADAAFDEAASGAEREACAEVAGASTG